MNTPSLASGPDGRRAPQPLLDTVLDALADGAHARGGSCPPADPTPWPRGCGPSSRTHRRGTDPDVLRALVHALAEGAADPLCAAHPHCPPRAVAALLEPAEKAAEEKAEEPVEEPVEGNTLR